MTLTELQEIVPGLTEETLQRIVEYDYSPQAMALHWVSEDPYDDWNSLEDWRKVQRYTLVVFFYAMNGPSWFEMEMHVRLDWLTHHKHEVSWWILSR